MELSDGRGADRQYRVPAGDVIFVLSRQGRRVPATVTFYLGGMHPITRHGSLDHEELNTLRDLAGEQGTYQSRESSNRVVVHVQASYLNWFRSDRGSPGPTGINIALSYDDSTLCAQPLLRKTA